MVLGGARALGIRLRVRGDGLERRPCRGGPTERHAAQADVEERPGRALDALALAERVARLAVALVGEGLSPELKRGLGRGCILALCQGGSARSQDQEGDDRGGKQPSCGVHQDP